MMHQLIEKLPQMAFDTRKSLSQAFQNVRQGNQYNFNPIRLSELLSSKNDQELIEAMKMLLLSHLQNKDLQVYLSKIINLLPREDLVLKRLCHIILTEIAASYAIVDSKNSSNESRGDVLILSISPIYKDIANFQTTYKLYALKSLPMLLLPETNSLLIASLKQIVVDKNPLVRRVAANTLLKLRSQSNELVIEDYQEQVDFLLQDSPQVRLSAINALIELRDDLELQFFHQRYFQVIKELPQLNHLDMERSVRFLHQYATKYFSYCKGELKIKKGNTEQDVLDLITLLDGVEKLLKLPYPAVIVAVGNLFLDFPLDSRLKKLISTLIRFLNISSESKFIILQMLNRCAQRFPHLLREHYRAFTIIQIEKIYCKIKKLEILQLLIDENNFPYILEELLHHTKSNQPLLVAASVKLLGITSQKYTKFVRKTVKVLVDVLRTGPNESKNHVVQAFCTIMNEQKSPTMLPLLTLCLQYLDAIHDIHFKCCVIRLLNREHRLIPTIAAENLRKLTQKFVSHHENVKFEILSLGYQIRETFEEKKFEQLQTINMVYEYLLTLCQFDQSILVRDLARCLNCKQQKLQTMDEHIMHLAIQGSVNPDFQENKDFQFNYPIGSLSGLVGMEEKNTMKVEDVQFSQQDTSKLRKVVISEPTPSPQIKQQVQQVVKESNPQQIVEPPKPEELKKKKKDIEEEVKKHYSNLDQVLNDFLDNDS